MRWPYTALLLTLTCAPALPAVADESEQENPFADLPDKPDKGESHAANAFEQAKDSIAVVVARSPDGSPVSQGFGVLEGRVPWYPERDHGIPVQTAV